MSFTFSNTTTADDQCVRPTALAASQAARAKAVLADVAVVPSIRDDAGNVDGLPNTVMEVMASGTPLVTTLAGGIGSVVEDGVTARVVPERDAAAIGSAVAELLRNPALGSSLGGRARETACREHSWDRVARSFERIYQTVAAPDRAAEGN